MDNQGYVHNEGPTHSPAQQLQPVSSCSRRTGKDSEKLKATSVKPVELQKTLGFFSCIGILVGGIIGSGIFISPKGILIGTGSVGMSLIIWTACGFFSLLGSLAFAELGNLLPTATGGDYYYYLAALHPNRRKEKSFWRPVIPFLSCWQANVLLRPASTGIQAMAFASYFLQLFSVHDCEASALKENSSASIKLTAAAFIMIVAAVNAYSIKLSTRLINVLTCCKLLAVFLIIAAGLGKLSQGTNEALKSGFEGTTLTLNGIATAFYSGLWAYGGWDNLNNVTKEMINPKRDLLRSLVITNVLITSIYLLANMAYFIVLSKNEFLASDAVAVDFSYKLVGIVGSVYMIASVASSILGSSFGGTFTGIRVMYAAAREGHMLECLSYIHHEKMTPSPALLFNAIFALLLLPHSNILGLLSIMGFSGGFFSMFTMVSLLILKKRKKKDDDSFSVPVLIPITQMLFSLFLVVTPLIGNPRLEHLLAMVFLMTGFLVYVVFVYYEKRIPGLGKVNVLVQKFMLVLPPEDEVTTDVEN